MGTPDADDRKRPAEPGDGDTSPGWWAVNGWNLFCWFALLAGTTTFAAVVYGPWQAVVVGGFVAVMFAWRWIPWRR